MPDTSGGGYPPRDAVIAYLAAYEARYQLPIRRPMAVAAVERAGTLLRVMTDQGAMTARAVISATGTWRHPFIPTVPGSDGFEGIQIHSSRYRQPADFAGLSVLVVGGGNSGAQIMAEVAQVAARCLWVTERKPVFLPDDVDGRVLFERATARWHAEREGRPAPAAQGGLGDVVAVPPVREARARGALGSVRGFARLEARSAVWSDGTRVEADAIIWCTGFRPALAHLTPLGLINGDGRIPVTPGGQADGEPRHWLLGYGDWTGMASATLAGVTRAARECISGVVKSLG